MSIWKVCVEIWRYVCMEMRVGCVCRAVCGDCLWVLTGCVCGGESLAQEGGYVRVGL